MRSNPSIGRRLRRSQLARVVGVFLVAVAAPASAAERVLVLDAEASEITFTLAATLHTVRGSAPLTEGRVRFDPATGAASGRVVVDATAIETGNRSRDRKMHREVLESGRYPQIVFSPRRLAGDWGAEAAGEVTLAGEIELHGGRHAMSITARVVRSGDRVRAEGTLTVPYVEWGMEDPSSLLLRVGKTVEVTLAIVGSIEGPIEGAGAAP